MTLDFTIPPDLFRGEAAQMLPLAGEVNYGMSLMGVDALRRVTTGSGVTAGVVDTGVDRSHPLLANVAAARDFTGSRIGSGDVNEHGTHTTGTVGATDPRIGVAPGCRLVHGKALSDAGAGAGDWIADAMQFCADEGAGVISMSLGSPSEDRTITRKMQKLADQGIWIVAAAGNSGPNTPDVDWPGRSPHCISVAAVDSRYEPASFSSAGAKIDTSGPGVNIWSTRPGGGFRQMSGTSMATPFVAGVLTLLRARMKQLGLPIPGVAALRQLLFSRSTDAYTPGDDRRTGPGWITPLLLELALVPDPPRVA